MKRLEVVGAIRPHGPLAKPRPNVLVKADMKKALAAQERACRKVVDARDQRRCFFPNCRERAGEKHHIQQRSLGGEWIPENILSACSTHHAMFKAGLIRVMGNPNVGPIQVFNTRLGFLEGVEIPLRKAVDRGRRGKG